MYSIVMLTALSAGADIEPAPPPRPVEHPVVIGAPAGCAGYNGCYGSYSVGCYGSGYGCSGSCHGGFFGRRHGGFAGGRKSCHGCSGYSCSGYNCFASCHGSGYSSCYGSCYGGCAGAGYAGYMTPPTGYGSSWGPPVGMLPYTAHGYNLDPHRVWGAGPPVVYWNLTASGAPSTPSQSPMMSPPVPPAGKGSDDSPMAANIKFTVPAETKLYVDGRLTPGTGTDRAFHTPPLGAGKFFYDVKAELVVGGKTITEERRVIVEAGANLTESFPKLTAAANGSSTVAGK